LVDIHCHLLPGVDDGAADWNETLAMARVAVADGISTIIVTPHQLGSHASNHGDSIRARTGQLQDFFNQQGVPLRVLPGADVRIEPELVSKLLSGEVLTLADRRRHVLLELPHEVYLPLDGLLARLRAVGMVGILSHPERNSGILANRAVVGHLVQAGCLMQVTAGALIGNFGRQVQGFAQSLLQQGLIHFIATDAHGVNSRPPSLRPTFEYVARSVGYQKAVELCYHNPALVAAGKTVCPSRKTVRSGLGGWFRQRKAG
jgi:protein-tyrosine phosphatase